MLIDTNVLIWYALEPARLSKRAIKAIRDGSNSYSHVSVWELVIKSSMGKLDLRGPRGQRVSTKQFMLMLIRELSLSALVLDFDDLAGVETLPFHHKDPFDRLLVVQAQRAKMPIVSPDRFFDQYGIERVW
jgi:PIN domain nuclease of toxin-antitoxin system